MLGVSPSRSRLLTGSHRYHPGIVQQAQGRSAETAVSPHHSNECTNLEQNPVTGSSEYGKESSGFIIGGKFLTTSDAIIFSSTRLHEVS
jgi:hypothetical protein